MAAKNRVTINLEDREYAELSALSDKHRVSLAWLGRQAIIEFLERRESRRFATSADSVLRETPRGSLKQGIKASWRPER